MLPYKSSLIHINLHKLILDEIFIYPFVSNQIVNSETWPVDDRFSSVMFNNNLTINKLHEFIFPGQCKIFLSV